MVDDELEKPTPEAPAPEPPAIVVAGHICLDVLPEFLSGGLALLPGGLTQMGPVTFAAGGGVANVGLALGKLGVPAKLVAKVGDDLFGKTIADLLHHSVTASLAVSPGDATSYSIVISPLGFDRHFLHHPGCNDTFSPTEIDPDIALGATFFYFGYPTLMQAVYADGGTAFAELLKAVRSRGVATAVDMALPDPQANSGRVDWPAFLERVLPHVDVFVPSLAEAVYMLEPDTSPANTLEEGLASRFYDLTGRLLAMGAAVAGLKLGEHGLYLRTAGDRISASPAAFAPGWEGRELWSPAFVVKVVNTVGAGDAAYAGLMSAIVKGSSIEDALTAATAVGSCSVESSDVSGGVRSWEATRARLSEGWARATHHAPPSWTRHASSVYLGPHDPAGR